MKILIVNYEFRNFFGGTQTWCTTMMKAFSAMGHECFLSAIISTWDAEIVKYKAPSDWNPDLIICNSNEALRKYRHHSSVICFISHGILPDLEQPVLGADLYFSVSEEVSENLANKGFKSADILRNPILIDEDDELKDLNPTLKTIAVISRRRRMSLLSELQKTYQVKEIGNPPVRDITEHLKDVDLVIGTGRVIYESMAKGKCVVVSGTNSGRGVGEWSDGYLTYDNFYDIRKCNCSGRWYKKRIDKIDELHMELEKFKSQDGIRNRQLIIRENEALKIAGQLLFHVDKHKNRVPWRRVLSRLRQL